MDTIPIVQARKPDAIGNLARVSGWVRTRRDSKAGFSFLEINDGSCQANLQVIVDQTVPNYESEVKRLNAGCSVTVEGIIKKSMGKGQATELQSQQVLVHGWADPASYPLQKKRHSFEILREWAHLQTTHQYLWCRDASAQPGVPCRSMTFFKRTVFCTFTRRSSPRAIAKVPARCFVLRRWTWRICHGVMAPGRLTAATFSSGPAYLTVSGQLEAEIFATVRLGKVYTFGPTFRAENSNTSRHLAEFWMVEPEMAFFDLYDNMDFAETVPERICHDVLEHCLDDMNFFNLRVDYTVIETLQNIVEIDFIRLPYTDAIEILEKEQPAIRISGRMG